MKSIVFFITLMGVMATVAFASDDRFYDMEMEADAMLMALAEEKPVEESKEVSALERILANLIERIRVRVEERHQSAQDLLVKVREIVDRLKDLHVRKGAKLQALLERLHGRVRELVRGIIDKLTGRPRSLRNSEDSVEKILEELELEELLMKTFVMSATQHSESRVRRDAEGEKKKSTFESIKDVFKGLTDHLFGRYQEFIEWLKTVWGKGIEKAKGHHQRLVAIAKEVIQDAKDMHKETLREALEILRPYRKELGTMWDELVQAVNKALKQ